MAKFILSAFADEAGESLDAQIAALKRNGISFLEVRNINGGPTLKKTDNELRSIRRRLDAEGIAVSSFGSPIGKYPIGDGFDAHLQDFRRALEICHILGTERMRMFSFFVPKGKEAESRPEVLSRLQIMLNEAKAADITLCHENETGIYGESPECVEDLLTSLPDLRAIYDPANYIFNQHDARRGFDVSLGRFAYMHIKDCLYEGSTIVPAGYGDGDIKEALKTIDRFFDGEVVLTVEPHLFVSESYKKFDGKELNLQFSFGNSGEAFDYAVSALKKLLLEIGHTL